MDVQCLIWDDKYTINKYWAFLLWYFKDVLEAFIASLTKCHVVKSWYKVTSGFRMEKSYSDKIDISVIVLFNLWVGLSSLSLSQSVYLGNEVSVESLRDRSRKCCQWLRLLWTVSFASLEDREAEEDDGPSAC